MNLATEYAHLCRTPSDIFEHLPTLFNLVTTRDAQHVIELGSRSGVSTVAWLHALAQIGGRLTSVDLDPPPGIGAHEHWTHIQGNDLDPAVIEQLEPADIVFIDTSHEYKQTLRELHTYRWLVKPGGLIVCHDTELARPEFLPLTDPVFPVRKAVTEFCNETGFQWVNNPACNGLGIIKVV